MWLLLEQSKIGWRVLYCAPKAKPGIQRDLAHGLRWHIAQVHCHHPNPPRLDQQIHSAQSLVDIWQRTQRSFASAIPAAFARQRIKTVARASTSAQTSPIFRFAKLKRKVENSCAQNMAAPQISVIRAARQSPPAVHPFPEYRWTPIQMCCDRDRQKGEATRPAQNRASILERRVAREVAAMVSQSEERGTGETSLLFA